MLPKMFFMVGTIRVGKAGESSTIGGTVGVRGAGGACDAIGS